MNEFKKTLFISENDIKDTSYLDENIEPKLIKVSILKCQDLIIQRVLGGVLYRLIQKQIFDDNLEDRFKLLLDDYIQNALLWAVLSDSQLPLSYKMRNKGVQKQNSENSESADLSEIKFLKQEFTNSSQMYLFDLENYLCANTKIYPEYIEYKEGEVLKRQNTINNTFYLGNANKELFPNAKKHKLNDILGVRRW
jgi:hypothetical protein